MGFVGSSTKNGTDEAMGFLTEEVQAVFGSVLAPDRRSLIDATRAIPPMFADPPGGEAWETAFGSAMMVPQAVRAAMFSRVLDNDDVLAALRAPTLVIHGTGDRIVRLSAGEHTARMLPGVPLTVYEGVGHATWPRSSARSGGNDRARENS